jgi:dipeptidyl aminopeptidase/acylaminoacyl peptidase
MKRLPDPTFDPRVADWLEADPSEAPREVLGTVLAAFPSITQRPAMRRPWRSPQMYRFAFPVAAALAIVVAGALVLPQLLTPPAGNPSPSPSIDQASTIPTENPTDQLATPEPTQGASLVAFGVRIFNGTGRSTVWVISVDGSTTRQLVPDEAGVTLLGRTSDGDRVLVALAGELPSMALVDIDTGNREVVPADCPTDVCWADFQSPFGTFGTVSLTADDRTALMVLREEPSIDLEEGRGHESIATVDLATGATTVIEGSRGIFVPGPGLVYPRLSPDGQKVAYIVGDADPTGCFGVGGMLRVVDRFGDSDTQLELAPFSACAADPRWSPTSDRILYTTNEVTNIPTGTTPEGGTTYFAVEHHDVYLVSLAGEAERLTTGRVSSHGAWTRDGDIAFARCDPNCDEPGLEVWILDPQTGERSKVDGTLAALDEAGCVECPFLLVSDDPPHNGVVVGFWPEDRDGR